jgi:hypothetical protein
VSLTAPYDPYGLQAAADQLDAARREVRAAARIAAPFLRRLAAATPSPGVNWPVSNGPSVRDIVTAPWHLAHGIAVGWKNTLRGWAAEAAQEPGLTPGAADHYAEGVGAGFDEAVPALGLLGDLLLMVGGAKLAGEMRALEEPAPESPRPAFTSNDPHVAGLANEIERELPGRIVSTNSLRAMVNGNAREVDIDLGDLIVQVKSGNARGITRQILETQTKTGVDTVGYAPTLKEGAWRNAAAQGIVILRTPSELIAYLKEFR